MGVQKLDALAQLHCAGRKDLTPVSARTAAAPGRASAHQSTAAAAEHNAVPVIVGAAAAAAAAACSAERGLGDAASWLCAALGGLCPAGRPLLGQASLPQC